MKILHHGTVHDNYGMRESINRGVRISRGKYIMKTDEHCLFDKGFDTKLIADCEKDWVVVPRRKRLDADAWKIIEDGRADIDYMSIAYSYATPYDRRSGLYGGVIDKQRTEERKNILIDETFSMQGSCWFMRRKYWDQIIGRLEDEHYGKFNHEAQELHFKVQLSGGKLMVNKKTFYAHMHKGARGKGYNFSNEQYREHERDKERARRYCMNFWLLNKWSKPPRKYDFAWLIEKFNPPGWPADWQTRIHEDAKKDWSRDPSKQPTEWVNPDGLPDLEI